MPRLEIVQVAPTDGPSLSEPILRSVPGWFANEEATRAYIRKTGELPTAVARLDGKVVGFLSLLTHAPRAAEIHCIAVLKEYHGRGIGSSLVGWAESSLRMRGIEYLQVKTMGPSKPSKEYALTARFYERCGFVALEEIQGLWPEVPCLIYIKKL